MNFDTMPELHIPYAYPGALAIMVVVMSPVPAVQAHRLVLNWLSTRGRPKVLTSSLRAYAQVRTCTILRPCSGAPAVASHFSPGFCWYFWHQSCFISWPNQPAIQGGTAVPVQGLFTDKGGKPE